jgi:NAD-dependent dihydropyrimidine dehydrogenase PreA subunit
MAHPKCRASTLEADGLQQHEEHPMSSLESCKQEPGVFVPLINRNRCEGKADCVAVCPVGVFKVDTLPPEQRAGLKLQGRIKGFVHRWQQAILIHPSACEACGLCVKACPEKAITLVRS